MSRLGYEVGVDGVPRAVADLRSVGAATTSAGQSASAAGGGFSQLGTSTQTAAQRLQGAASAVATLSSHLGAPGVSTGASLIASIGGSVAQFAAMGSMLGPGGTVLGAVAGLALGLAGLAEAHNQSAEAAQHQAEQLAGLAVAARNATTDLNNLQAGTFGTDTSDSELVTQREAQAAAVRAAQDRLSRVRGLSAGQRLATGADTGEAEAAVAEQQRVLSGIDAEIDRRDAQRVSIAAVAEEREREAAIVARYEEQARQLTEAAEGAERLSAQQREERARALAAQLAAEAAFTENLAGVRERPSKTQRFKSRSV